MGFCKAFFDPLIQLHKDTEYSKVVSISVDAPDAVIRYTLDGSEPTAASEEYSLPFVINRSQEVAAAAFRSDKKIGKTTYKKF